MRLAPYGACAWAAISLSSAAWAQVPAGSVFQVNTYTTGRQAFPQIGMRPQGDFVVIWDHRLDGVAASDVFARRYTAGGAPIGGEFRVNAFTTNMQSVVFGGGIALDARGNGVVAWDDRRLGLNEVDVFARRVSAAGVPLGDDFMVPQPSFSHQSGGRVAMAPDGRFVVVWNTFLEVMGRRFDSFGNGLGENFRVSTSTTGPQRRPGVGMDAAGNFTVVWSSYDQGAVQSDVVGQRFDATGARLGGEFQVNTFSTGTQGPSAIAMNREGAFVVAWQGQGPGVPGTQVWARRYATSGMPQGSEFAMTAVPAGDAAQDVAVAMDERGHFVAAWNHFVAGPSMLPTITLRRFDINGLPREGPVVVATPAALDARPRLAADGVGNFLVGWHDLGADDAEVLVQRYGGLFAAGLAVEDGGNDVVEVADSFTILTSWRNLTGAAQTIQSLATGHTAPPGLTLALSPMASYGTVPDGAVGTCSFACFGGILAGTRPSGHVDLSFGEALLPEEQGQHKRWVLHVGESFTDVPRTSNFYRFVETLLHHGVTSGCAGTSYCPASSTTREQMAVFVLAAKEGSSYGGPPACGAPVFNDVPASSPFCRWIEELARRGVTGGCGGGNFCPTAAVVREQMAVFVLRTLDPALEPPACTTPTMFNDVPASSPFCRWIEELARRGVVAGCGGGNYCPTAVVTREQMAVFLTGTFGLTLYGP